MNAVVRKLRRFHGMNWHDRRVLLSAALLLPLFWLGPRLVGYRPWVVDCVTPGRNRFLDVSTSPPDDVATLRKRDPTGSAVSVQTTKLAELTRIGSLVNSAAHHVLPAGNCLARSVYLQRLLARRGVPTSLRIGVQLTGGQLLAHAWVEYEGHPLNDAPDVAEHYVPFERPLTAGAWVSS